MVMVSLLGSPLWVYEVGEGSFSLNHPRSHYLDHLNCSIWMVDSSIVTCLCLLSLCFQGVAYEFEEDFCASV